MNITAAQSRMITADIIAAITPVLEKHGLAVTKQSSNYGPYYGLKIAAGTPNVDEVTGVDMNSEYAMDFNMLRRSLGFPEDSTALGMVINMRGEQWKFLGYNTRAKTMPWMFERVRDGKIYKFPRTTGDTLLNAVEEAQK